MVRWAPARFDQIHCIQQRTLNACTPRQMRNGFFALNMLAWLVIVLAVRVFA